MKFRHLLGIFLVLALMNSWSYCSTSQPEKSQSDETEYFALFMDNHKIGHAIQDRVVEGDKVTTSIELSITISRTGIPVSVKMSSIAIETTDGKPLGFEMEQDLGIITMKTTGIVDENGKLTVITGQQKEERQWPKGALMSEGLRLLHYKYGLKEGTSYKAKIFEPSTMAVFDAEVNIGAKTNVDLLGRVVELTEIKSTASSEQIATLNAVEYYDDELKLQKSVTPVMGFTIEQIACGKEFALGENDVFEVVDKMFLSSPEPINNVSSVKSITYYLSQTTGTNDLKIPSNDNQKVKNLSNGNAVVTIEPIAAPTGIRFPYKGNDSTATEALEPTRYVESDKQIIKDLAKEAIGNTRDAAEAARKIETFVAQYITNKNLSVGYASAAEVAASKQGDCTEHAVLTAALCRAVGIPAQVVTGLAYVSQWRTLQNGFGGHAWNQVYIGNKWINLDAAFKSAGLGGYDAGHIALAIGNGDPEDFLNLINVMGKFKIDKIEVNKN